MSLMGCGRHAPSSSSIAHASSNHSSAAGNSRILQSPPRLAARASYLLWRVLWAPTMERAGRPEMPPRGSTGPRMRKSVGIFLLVSLTSSEDIERIRAHPSPHTKRSQIRRIRLAAVSARAQVLVRAGTERPGSDFILELARRGALRRDACFLPDALFDRSRLSLIPGQDTVGPCPLA